MQHELEYDPAVFQRIWHERCAAAEAEGIDLTEDGVLSNIERESMYDANALWNIALDDYWNNASVRIVPHAQTVLDAPTFELRSQLPIQGIFADVVMGENSHVFRLLERNINTMREQGSTMHLLLVGPPSVGKTMTAQIAARSLNRPMLPLSGATLGSNLFDVVDGPLAQLHNGCFFSEVYKHPDNSMPVYRVAPTTMFVDEAHALTDKIQTALLMATEKPYMISDSEGRYLDFRDVLIILGTTDPSVKSGGGGLVKPLRTRCIEVTFVHYGEEAVGEIVMKHYPRINTQDAELLARAAKLYPRVALSYAKQAGSFPITQFVSEFLGADSRGLDPTDHKLLALLESAVTYQNPLKKAEAEIMIRQHSLGGKVSELQLAKAEAYLNTFQPKPLGIQAIADKLMITDNEDVRARVHYMERLGLLARTSRGVVREKSGLDKQPCDM
jgi:Holliday junction resolvasome RuvABC ATP-dependent DNA helicase subunit